MRGGNLMNKIGAEIVCFNIPGCMCKKVKEEY